MNVNCEECNATLLHYHYNEYCSPECQKIGEKKDDIMKSLEIRREERNEDLETWKEANKSLLFEIKTEIIEETRREIINMKKEMKAEILDLKYEIAKIHEKLGIF